MSSTEQKNVNQPFIQHCFTYGILGTLLSREFANFGLETNHEPFKNLGQTDDLWGRLDCSDNPIEEAKLVMPVLRDARPYTRYTTFLTGLVYGATVKFGNQAVYALAEGIANNSWDLYFKETGAIKHAKKHTDEVCSLLAPGSYSICDRTLRNIGKFRHKSESARLRAAADAFEFLGTGLHVRESQHRLRGWCAEQRDLNDFESSYIRDKPATAEYRRIRDCGLKYTSPPPCISTKLISARARARYGVCLYSCGSYIYVRIFDRHARRRGVETSPDSKREFSYEFRSDVFCLSRRDIDDLSFLLQSICASRTYMERRLFDIRDCEQRRDLRRVYDSFKALQSGVFKRCAESFGDRNRAGAYFDVLQWRYLADLSGNVFFDHSEHMGKKIKSKGLKYFPDQGHALSLLKGIGIDAAIDILGIYKCSIYPEVDPFKVVVDQMDLHMNRWQTEWEEGSAERVRFNQTKAYMWYLGIYMIHGKMGVWPGKIRNGVDKKDWHRRYKIDGIPSTSWEDAHDVDLTGTIQVTEISNEQYMRQQDSACAPPHSFEYKEFEKMRKAPRRHKRKLLYAIQEAVLPDLEETMRILNVEGERLPDGYVGKLEIDLGFTTDIVTGSRCERHKEAPRPFYAASSPWGCILSYVDGITRDFLRNVPQSMLGKSTRQKFIDISTVVKDKSPGTRQFLMSDDKAKYSPHMDPNSQQLPADFFAEVFNLPAIKAIGPIMYHNELYYRVCGHLVHYNSNGTDREGMRGASNTWLEIVAQGLSTRLCRDRKLTVGKSYFLSFIDDGLRKFAVRKDMDGIDRSEQRTREVIADVEFGLKVLGRELSWDKTFVSRDLCVILNELMYDGAHFSSGLKSYCTAGDIEMKPVMGATDFEQLYFSKMRGAHGVGAPLDLCHYTYVFETLVSHYRLGLRLQDNKRINSLEYRVFCITPVALGGSGIRSLLQLGSNEVATATKEGIGSLMRLAANSRVLSWPILALIDQEMEELSPIDFMREPEQFHVTGPRLKSQRVTAAVRRKLHSIASNDLSRKHLEMDNWGLEILNSMGQYLMAVGGVGAEEVRLLYAITPVAFVDEFIQKLASSATLAEMLDQNVIASLRRAVRRDLKDSTDYFRERFPVRSILDALGSDLAILSQLSSFI